MKFSKVFIGLCFLLMLIGISNFNTKRSFAFTDRQYYEAGDTVYIDLDGDGKTESVTVQEEFKGILDWKLIINGKTVAGYALYDSETPDCDGLTFEFLNIYTKDEYIEIGLNFYLGFPGSVYGSVMVFRYKAGKCELLFSKENNVTYEIWDEQKKKDHVLVSKCKSCDLGLIFYKAEYKIKNKKLIEVKNKSKVYAYDGSYPWRDKFTANGQITIYKKNNLKQQVGKIQAGEKFKVYKVKENKNGDIIAAYVKASNGKKGWIDVNTKSGWYEDGLVTDPLLWG